MWRHDKYKRKWLSVLAPEPYYKVLILLASAPFITALLWADGFFICWEMEDVSFDVLLCSHCSVLSWKKNLFLYVYYSNRLNARLMLCLGQASSWLNFAEAWIWTVRCRVIKNVGTMECYFYFLAPGVLALLLVLLFIIIYCFAFRMDFSLLPRSGRNRKSWLILFHSSLPIASLFLSLFLFASVSHKDDGPVNKVWLKTQLRFNQFEL